MNFFADARNDIPVNVPLLFQKKDITIQASCAIEADVLVYTFLLTKKKY